MKRIPNINNPSLEVIEEHSINIPCYKMIKDILIEESNRGNRIIDIGNAGALPDETIIIIRFCLQSSEEPQRRIYSDNNGCVELWFGCNK